MSEIIEHKAVVREIKENKAFVQVFIDNNACQTCKIKNSCAVAKMNNKILEINGPETNLKKGEEIKVYFTEKTGLKAVLIGYVLPFIILIIALVISLQITGDEGKSGLIALGSMIFYYFSLLLFRKQLKKTFNFKIKKINKKI